MTTDRVWADARGGRYPRPRGRWPAARGSRVRARSARRRTGATGSSRRRSPKSRCCGGSARRASRRGSRPPARGVRALDDVSVGTGEERLAHGLASRCIVTTTTRVSGIEHALAKQRDTVAVRERQVHQDDIGPMPLEQVERPLDARALADDIEAVGRQDQSQAFADQMMVLDERDPDRPAERPDAGGQTRPREAIRGSSRAGGLRVRRLSTSDRGMLQAAEGTLMTTASPCRVSTRARGRRAG